MLNLMTILTVLAKTPSIEVSDDMQKTTVNFRLQVNLIIIEVKVNGVQKDFILDTGASRTTVASALIQELGITEVEKVKARGVGGEVDASIVRINSMAVGDITLHDFTCGVVNMQDMGCVVGGDVAGVLGFDFLSHFIVTIDYRNKQLHLVKYPEEESQLFIIDGNRFESPKYKFEISRADDSWNFKTTTPLPDIPVIIEKENSAVRLQVQELHGMALDDILPMIESSLPVRIQEYALISSSRVKSSKHEYQVYEYTGKKDGKDLQIKHIVFKSEEFLYNIICTADPTEFPKLAKDFNRMVDSFAFLKK